MLRYVFIALAVALCIVAVVIIAFGAGLLVCGATGFRIADRRPTQRLSA